MQSDLRQRLLDIQRRIPGLKGFVIFTNEGFLLISTVSPDVPGSVEEDVPLDEYFSAVGAGILNMAKKALEQMGISPMSRLIVESGKGHVIVRRIDDEVSIMAVSNSTTSVGMVGMALEQAIDVYRELID